MPRDDAPVSSSLAELAALGQVWEEHRSRLLGMLRGRIDPKLAVRLDPEDVLQNAWLDAERKWPAFGQSGLSAYSWLYRIVRDRLIEEWRINKRDKRDMQRDERWPEQTSVQLGLNLMQAGTTPSGRADREEIVARVQQALELLKQADREIIDLRHIDQLSFGEAGEVLGISENTANVRYVRALRRLKDIWLRLFST